MKVLVINCGSSSLKYQLIDMENENLLAKGLADRIGIKGSIIEHETIGKEKKVIERTMEDHKAAIEIILETLVDPAFGAIESMDEIGAVGHRVVHGGEKFSASAIITDEVMKGIEESSELAPLHNPPNIIGINACKKILPNIPMVAVFDTAFHQTMPESSYIYALPYSLYEKHKIRRYGFHGTSHKFVSYRAAELIEKPIEDLKIITCHLGNGASITAIDGGKSVDTSMGFTPLQGLAMGTRSGDLDPAIVTYLMKKENLTYDQMDEIMNKQSGVLGISGISNDFRDLETAAEEGNKRAQLALDIYYKIVIKYIGAYAAEMGGLDAIVFTAGLGENSPKTRLEICKQIEFLGLKIDENKNNVRGIETILTTEDSKVKVLLVPTNEELAIARETIELL